MSAGVSHDAGNRYFLIALLKTLDKEISHEKKKKLTTRNGAAIVDKQNVLSAGLRGPQLLPDFWLLEKLAHFDREVIPERRMHAKGSSAFGTFTVTQTIIWMGSETLLFICGAVQQFTLRKE